MMRMPNPNKGAGCPYPFVFETSPNLRKGEVSNAPTPAQTPAECWYLETGTGCAINYNTIGVAAHCPCYTISDQRPCKRSPCVVQRGTAAGKERTLEPTAPGRGGARNRADRETDALSLAHVANLKAATVHATEIGLPFTRMISIHWQAASVPLSGMAKATGRFVDLMSKTLARHGSRAAWLWVHENGDSKGWHCHLLVHVPADQVKRVTAHQKGWLRTITENPYRARVIKSRPIGGRLGIECGNPELHAINLEAALSYVLKGASAAAAARFHLERLTPSGRVIGKRCGTSQNIAASARNQRNDHG
jgi:hypothetical protein